MTPEELLQKISGDTIQAKLVKQFDCRNDLSELESLKEKFDHQRGEKITLDDVFEIIDSEVTRLQLKLDTQVLYSAAKTILKGAKKELREIRWNLYNNEFKRKRDEQEARDLGRGQIWHLKGDDLNSAVKALQEQKLNEVMIAELCGYYLEDDNGKKVLIDSFKDACEESQFLGCSERVFHLINNQLAYEMDESPTFIYLPERCIKAEPDRYASLYWEELTKEENEFAWESIYEDQEEPYEVMMETTINQLNYVNPSLACPSDTERLKVFGINSADVHPFSEIQ